MHYKGNDGDLMEQKGLLRYIYTCLSVEPRNLQEHNLQGADHRMGASSVQKGKVIRDLSAIGDTGNVIDSIDSGTVTARDRFYPWLCRIV